MINLRASHRDKTLRITRGQYRQFAELSKSVGLGLNLSNERRMKGWGSYAPWGLLTCNDVTRADTGHDEHALLTLAATVDTRTFRAAGAKRPELDWSALANDEIYPFVVWHEIGHRCDNFNMLGWASIADQELKDQCAQRATLVNEVMADRFAWGKVRPGEPLPMTERGQALQEQIAESIELLDKYLSRVAPTAKPLAPGQYCDVPEYMLATAERAQYVGPRVDPALLRKCVAHHRRHAQTSRRPLYLTGVPW